MQPHNLFSLLADRLLLHPTGFTMATYNVLFEVGQVVRRSETDMKLASFQILVEKVSGPVVEKRSAEITADWKIENSGKPAKSKMSCA